MKTLIIISIIFIFFGCSTNYTLKNTPDIAQLNLSNNKFERGEFISFIDSNIVLNVPPKLTGNSHAYLIPINKIEKVKIEDYNNSGWLLPLILIEAVPAIVLAITASSTGMHNGTNLAALFSLPFIINSFIYLATDRPVEFSRSDIKADPHNLTPYAFYPGGIHEDKLNRILLNNNQTSLDSLYFNDIE